MNLSIHLRLQSYIERHNPPQSQMEGHSMKDLSVLPMVMLLSEKQELLVKDLLPFPKFEKINSCGPLMFLVRYRRFHMSNCSKQLSHLHLSMFRRFRPTCHMNCNHRFHFHSIENPTEDMLDYLYK